MRHTHRATTRVATRIAGLERPFRRTETCHPCRVRRSRVDTEVVCVVVDGEGVLADLNGQTPPAAKDFAGCVGRVPVPLARWHLLQYSATHAYATGRYDDAVRLAVAAP